MPAQVRISRRRRARIVIAGAEGVVAGRIVAGRGSLSRADLASAALAEPDSGAGEGAEQSEQAAGRGEAHSGRGALGPRSAGVSVAGAVVGRRVARGQVALAAPGGERSGEEECAG